MLVKIVSGGQTGADRAGFEVALELGLEVGGWVPKGRKAEDGVIPSRYPGLVETESTHYRHRTERNVDDADATVIFSHGRLSGGSALTLRYATSRNKPVLHLDLQALPQDLAVRQLRDWLAAVRAEILNIAGPRASNDPAIFGATKTVLGAALRGARQSNT